MSIALLATRSQHAKGTWPRQGPDHYIAVQIVPDGVIPLRSLQARAAKLRGIKIVYCGEYYGNRTGPRSAYAAALRAAKELIARVNYGEGAPGDV